VKQSWTHFVGVLFFLNEQVKLVSIYQKPSIQALDSASMIFLLGLAWKTAWKAEKRPMEFSLTQRTQSLLNTEKKIAAIKNLPSLQ